MPLLLLDLDNTVANRDAAFQHWLGETLSVWAPGDEAARAFLIECDDDGMRPWTEFFLAARARFRLLSSVEALLEDYRRLTLDGFPPMDSEAAEQLTSMRGQGWKIAVVTNGEAGVQQATAQRVGLAPLLDAFVVSGAVGVRKPEPRIFALAAELSGASLTGSWMVGDGEVDVLGAARGRAHRRTGGELHPPGEHLRSD